MYPSVPLASSIPSKIVVRELFFKEGGELGLGLFLFFPSNFFGFFPTDTFWGCCHLLFCTSALTLSEFSCEVFEVHISSLWFRLRSTSGRNISMPSIFYFFYFFCFYIFLNVSFLDFCCGSRTIEKLDFLFTFRELSKLMSPGHFFFFFGGSGRGVRWGGTSWRF